MTATKLPKLPEPDCSTDDAHHGSGEPAYTLEALRAYGDEREAYGRATSVVQVDDDLITELKRLATRWENRGLQYGLTSDDCAKALRAALAHKESK